ncbi:MAG: glucosamine-6-phosphate synthase, partial [Acidimicrobiia bacterium]|nr:glucosamine-6-phosphate synthase [Acidimicrobiia bacterium]
MCGIIAVLRRPSDRPIPGLTGLEADLGLARGHLESARALLESSGLESSGGALDASAEIRLAAAHIGAVDQSLRGVPGALALLSDSIAAASLESMAISLSKNIVMLESILDAGLVDADHLEELNEALIEVKDAQWAVSSDRIKTARSIAGLLNGLDPATNHGAVAAMHSVQVALSAIDRLEVRGRDSAGLQLFVTNPALDLSAPDVLSLIEQRADERLYRSGAVCIVDGALVFVYKAAAEIGELGDNVAALRRSISEDALLHLAIMGASPQIAVLGHTRWASVGIISEANAHPLNNIEGIADSRVAGPYVAAAVNGDVDNFRELIEQNSLSIPAEITTDAKVIPALVSRAISASGTDLTSDSDSSGALISAFSKTVATFEGSMAIAAHSGTDPNQLLLALRGSGQALYIGLADDSYVVASEPYGVVEEASQYVRLDGETPSDLDNPEASRGQIVALDATQAGSLSGIRRFSYDGSVIEVGAEDLARAEVTTRDIDLGAFPHFLLKEISESPASFRKTLRAKLIERDGSLVVDVGNDALPDAIRERLSAGALRRVLVIGQGTAAVAGQSLAAALSDLAGSRLVVEALPATELSGFRLSEDMTETLVIAIS